MTSTIVIMTLTMVACDATETSPPADPRDALVDLLDAAHNEDWDAIRTAVGSPFDELGDQAIEQAASDLVTAAEREQIEPFTIESWEVEEYENWTTIRHINDRWIAFVFQSRNGQWKLAPNPYLTDLGRAIDITGDLSQAVDEVESATYIDRSLEGPSSVPVSFVFNGWVEALRIEEESARLRVRLRIVRSSYAIMDLSEISYIADDTTGDVEVVWSNAQMENDEQLIRFPASQTAQVGYHVEFQLTDFDTSADSFTFNLRNLSIVDPVLPDSFDTSEDEFLITAKYELPAEPFP